MSNLHQLDLTFPTVEYGIQETPWDLRPLLFYEGASANIRKVEKLIANGELGKPIKSRVVLVKGIHEAILGFLVGGGSRHTAGSCIENLRRFITWAEKYDASAITLKSVEEIYLNWTEHLLYRERIVGDISAITVRKQAASVARLLDEVLDLKVGLFQKARISNKTKKGRAIGKKADKQNVEQTIKFCHALLDISDALDVDAIKGPLPVQIQFRTGGRINEWSGLKDPDNVKALKDGYAWPNATKIVMAARAKREADVSLRSRFVLVNLRIQAELMMFIAQTGMNLAQAHCLRIGKFRYRSHLDGYQVHRVYKERKRGEVEFEIFSEYKVVFERYLKWRGSLFLGDLDDRLFPLVNRRGCASEKAADVPTNFFTLEQRMKKIGVRFIPPSTLRKTRINWLLRNSKDAEMTAEMHAHTQETLIQYYEQPHLQVAQIEISRFHARNDPAIVPPGPGLCIKAEPKVIPDAPIESPTPDCASPAGCLFCEHQRDIDSEDYVWSLSSYRHFKSLELSRYRLAGKGIKPVTEEATIERLTAKLKYFKKSGEVRSLWVCEALARVEEGDYHPRWFGFIQLMELKAWQ